MYETPNNNKKYAYTHLSNYNKNQIYNITTKTYSKTPANCNNINNSNYELNTTCIIINKNNFYIPTNKNNKNKTYKTNSNYNPNILYITQTYLNPKYTINKNQYTNPNKICEPYTYNKKKNPNDTKIYHTPYIPFKNKSNCPKKT